MLFDLFSTGFDWVWRFGVPFVVVLSVLVFVHEWGHYAVARYFKVKIDEFSIGFGPELVGWTDKSGCRWKFCAIPLGGFVKMFGDAGAASTPDADKIDSLTDEEKKGTFYGKPVHARALIVLAGPMINYIFAILLLASLFIVVGRPVTPPVIGAVLLGSTAEQVGLEPGDKIISLNGQSVTRFEDISRFVALRLDQPMTMVLERNGATKTIDNVRAKREELTDRFGFTQTRARVGVTSVGVAIDAPKVTHIDGKAVEAGGITWRLKELGGQRVRVDLQPDDPQSRAPNGFIIDVPTEGIEAKEDGTILLQPAQQDIIHYDPVTGIITAFTETWDITISTLEAVGQMISGVRSADELGGLIRIGAVASDAAAGGIAAFIMFTALLSINLGLINMFPVPMLDGGHLVFYAYEAVAKKPIPEKVQEGLFKVGFFALITLMVFANGNDILQLLL